MGNISLKPRIRSTNANIQEDKKVCQLKKLKFSKSKAFFLFKQKINNIIEMLKNITPSTFGLSFSNEVIYSIIVYFQLVANGLVL